jgi:hypothetical protein
LRILSCELFLLRVFNETVKAVANATRSGQDDAGYMMLVVQSKDGGDEAFFSFTPDEIYAMVCAEEGMPKTVFVCPTCAYNGSVCRHPSRACI